LDNEIFTVRYPVANPSSFAGQVSSRNSNYGSPNVVEAAVNGGIEEGKGGENQQFSSFERQYLESGSR